VDYKVGTTTGISASDRAATVAALGRGDATAAQFTRPGHVFPLIAKPGGVLTRGGHTEASVDLCRLAGLDPAVAYICEVCSHETFEMLRLPDLIPLAQHLGMPLISIAALQRHLYHRTVLVRGGEWEAAAVLHAAVPTAAPPAAREGALGEDGSVEADTVQGDEADGAGSEAAAGAGAARTVSPALSREDADAGDSTFETAAGRGLRRLRACAMTERACRFASVYNANTYAVARFARDASDGGEADAAARRRIAVHLMLESWLAAEGASDGGPGSSGSTTAGRGFAALADARAVAMDAVASGAVHAAVVVVVGGDLSENTRGKVSAAHVGSGSAADDKPASASSGGPHRVCDRVVAEVEQVIAAIATPADYAVATATAAVDRGKGTAAWVAELRVWPAAAPEAAQALAERIVGASPSMVLLE
jgi:hypothetical protein